MTNRRGVKNKKELRDDWGSNVATSSYQKLWNYVVQTTQSEKFLRDVRKIRKEFGIPEGDDEEWVDNLGDDYWRAVSKLCFKYKLDPGMWNESISWLIVEDMLPTPADGVGLIVASEHHDLQCLCTQKLYPIVLAISPAASKRDLLDWVEMNFAEYIKPLQEKYKKASPLSSGRRQDPDLSEIYDYIYRSREKPQKEIQKIVLQRFGRSIEYPYIGKIISREKKRRQKA